MILRSTIIIIKVITDITTIPFEYLVISSGYTGRLLNELKTLSEFCEDLTIIPLYIKDDVHSDGQIKSFSFEDGIIEIIEPTVECEEIQTRLRPFGIIVFELKISIRLIRLFKVFIN